jgi:selenocysteine-specific translation elongation factor
MKMCGKLRDVLDKTAGFGYDPIVMTSTVDSSIGVESLKMAIQNKLKLFSFVRDTKSPLVLAVDHCFTIRGAGAVCTGTILQGAVKLGDVSFIYRFIVCK